LLFVEIALFDCSQVLNKIGESLLF
jgi:hypothetical protein